jgi:cyanate permease
MHTERDHGGIAGHPRGLSMLFYAEMWERFSYYGMRAILLLFMIAPLAMGGMGMDQGLATQIYGNYTMASYMVCILGGYLADNFIGARRAVLIGGLIITAGHYALAFNSTPTFYAGLILVALGTGLLKPVSARSSADSTRTATPGATLASRFSTWASTLALSRRLWWSAGSRKARISRRCSPAGDSTRRIAGTGALRRRASA